MTILSADRWIYSMLSASLTISAACGGRIYYGAAPEGTSYPLINFSQTSSVATLGICGEIIMHRELWTVSVWHARPNFTEIEPVAQAVVDALHKKQGSGIIACTYESSNRLADNEGEIEYRAIALEFSIYTEN